MNLAVFLQARLGSARLPGKVLFKICGKSMLELVVERLRGLTRIDAIILVTGPEEKNRALVQEAKRLDVAYFCGSENNLLDRFYKAALKFKPQAILRITGDCPLIDRQVLSRGIRIFYKGNYDVVSNVQKRTYPDGLVFEVFKRSALEESWSDQHGRGEIPTKHLLEDAKFFSFNMVQKVDMSHVRLTVDYAEDFQLIEKIYDALYKKGKYFGLKEVLEFLRKHPKLLDINKKFVKVDYGIRPQYNHERISHRQ